MKYCGEQGCRNLISSGRYCNDHRRRRKSNNNYRHSNKSFYNSAVWKRLSDYVYERDKGLCQRCGRFTHGRDAHRHHIIPVAEAPELKLDPNNVELLCNKCHVIVENEMRQKSVPEYFR